MNKSVVETNQAGEWTQIKGKPIETEFGQIIPGVGRDKIKGGAQINAGSMFMQMNAGTATFIHGGKSIKIDVGVTPTGGTLILTTPNRRMFVTNIQKVIKHAVANGLLDDELEFAKAEDK